MVQFISLSLSFSLQQLLDREEKAHAERGVDKEERITYHRGRRQREAVAMAEAPQEQQQLEEEEEQQQPSSADTTEPDEGSEEPKEIAQTPPTRPLLSMRSMSTVDLDDDTPNMIVYRKVRGNVNPVASFWFQIFLESRVAVESLNL